MCERTLANVSCVASAGRAILIEGPPGSGKSTLTLALIDRGAMLIGDDGIALERRGGQLWALPPPRIVGKLEVRGVGLIDLPTTCAPLALAVTLGDHCERLPEPSERVVEGIALPRIALPSVDAWTALRVEWALRLHSTLR